MSLLQYYARATARGDLFWFVVWLCVAVGVGAFVAGVLVAGVLVWR